VVLVIIWLCSKQLESICNLSNTQHDDLEPDYPLGVIERTESQKSYKQSCNSLATNIYEVVRAVLWTVVNIQAPKFIFKLVLEQLFVSTIENVVHHRRISETDN